MSLTYTKNTNITTQKQPLFGSFNTSITARKKTTIQTRIGKTMFDDKQAVVFNEKYNETFNYFKYMLSISKDLP